MAFAVARQKYEIDTTEPPSNERVGRLAEGSFDRHLAHARELRHLVKTAAADHTDGRRFHEMLASARRLPWRCRPASCPCNCPQAAWISSPRGRRTLICTP